MDNNLIAIQPFDPADDVNNLLQPRHLFYTRHWLSVLTQQYGYKLWKTQGPAGEYMLYAQAKGLIGTKLVSLPFSDYTIPNLEAARLPLHVAALQRYFPGTPILIKCPELYASPYALRFLGEPTAKALLHRIEISGKTEAGFSSSFRRGVRKAVKSGLTTHISCDESSLLHFYNLFYRLRIQKLGLIPQPISFFYRVYEQFIKVGEGFFFEVKQGDEVLASAIVLREGKTLYYKWGCSRQDRLYLRPNNLLFSELVKLAATTGCHYLDLGLSDLDETRGLIQFKKSMGGTSSFIYTYSLWPAAYPQEVEKKLKIMLNQMAGLVVEHQLRPVHTQSFSEAIYPLFI